MSNRSSTADPIRPLSYTVTRQQLDQLEDIVASLFEPVFDSLDEGVVVELDGQQTMLSREDLGDLARDTTVSIGPAVFVKDHGDHWKRGFEGFPLGSSKTDYIFYMMGNADTRPEVAAPHWN